MSTHRRHRAESAAAASSDGYYRYPALHGDTLLFVCEDDIYGVHATLGGRAHRVTDAPGPVRRPVISPDGALVAFTVSEPDGHEEIYVVSVEGGRMRRLTRAGADFARVATWSEDGEVLYFVTSASRAFPDDDTLCVASRESRRISFVLPFAHISFIHSSRSFVHVITR
jgi:tricorn protease